MEAKTRQENILIGGTFSQKANKAATEAAQLKRQGKQAQSPAPPRGFVER